MRILWVKARTKDDVPEALPAPPSLPHPGNSLSFPAGDALGQGHFAEWNFQRFLKFSQPGC